jgi:copper homeostasis protein (lipoprotein)
MKNLIYIFLMLVFFTACGEVSNTKVVEKTTVVVEDSEVTKIVDGANAQNSLDVVGTYKGVLPCADCEGMETMIELKSDSTYSRVIKYLGKKENSFTAPGKWTWVNGSTISLRSIKEGPNQYFVAEGKLIQLDMSGNRITGDLATKYELKKQ